MRCQNPRLQRFAPLATAITTGLAIATHAHAGEPSLLTDWNIVAPGGVWGNFQVGGSVFTGMANGPISVAQSAVTAPNNTAIAIYGAYTGEYPIVVGNGGDLRHSGALTGQVIFQDGGTTILDPTLPAMAPAFSQSMLDISTGTAALPTTGSLQVSGGHGVLMSADHLTIAGQRVAVYALSNSELAGLSSIDLEMGSADSVMINITTNGGGTVNFGAGSEGVPGLSLLGGFLTDTERVLWNYFDAHHVDIRYQHFGSILARGGMVEISTDGGTIDTSVTGSIASKWMFSNAPIHSSPYMGVIVPGPGGAAVLVIATAGMGVRRRR